MSNHGFHLLSGPRLAVDNTKAPEPETVAAIRNKLEAAYLAAQAASHHARQVEGHALGALLALHAPKPAPAIILEMVRCATDAAHNHQRMCDLALEAAELFAP